MTVTYDPSLNERNAMNIPFICLSAELDITDVSHEIKSLPGFRRDKDFLLTILEEDDLARIEELCSVVHYKTALSLKLKSRVGGHRFAKAVQNTDGGTVLYLAKDDSDLTSDGYTDCPDESFSDELFLPNELSAIPRCMDFAALTRIFGRIASQLSKSQLLAGRHLLLEFDDLTGHNGAVSFDTQAILYSSFCLVCAAARSTVGNMVFSVCRGEFTFSVSVRTQLCSMPPFVGSSFDVMSLAVFLRGSRPFLRRALLCAASAEMNLSFDISPDGTLCLNVSNLANVTAGTEFKFPENTADEYDIAEKLLSLLLSVQKKQDQKE